MHRQIDRRVQIFEKAKSVGQTALHVASGAEEFDQYACGLGEPEAGPQEMDTWNRRVLSENPFAGSVRVAERLEQAIDSFLDATADEPANSPLPAFRDVTAGLDAVTCVALGEVVVHSLDIARGLGMSWMIERSHARLVLAGTLAFLPLYLNEAAASAVRARFDLRVRGGDRYSITLHDGDLRVGGASAQRPDCVISADPVAFLLVGYGRASPIAQALRGKLLAWGRRPWLALRLPDLITQI